MKTIHFFTFLTIILFISSCVKEADKYISVTDNKYVIEMGQDYKIYNVKYYVLDSFVAQFIYQYSDSQLVITKKGANDLVQTKSVYYLKNKLADIVIDTFFNSGNPTIRKTEYEYDDFGYKTYASVYSKNTTDKEYKFDVRFKYVYSNGNAISIENNYGCSMEYRFGKLENKVDISSLRGNYCGRINQNLITNSASTCHGTSGTVPESSVYSYVFNESDLVVERTEIYTNSYHTGYEPEKEKRVSHFEYKIVN